MTDWFTTLGDLHERAWRELTAGAEWDTRQRVVLGTIGLSGGPETRIVVLRGADTTAATVAVHTDVGSTKVDELRNNPNATLHHWSDALQLQIRLRGRMKITTGPELADIWAQVPPDARSSYGVTPPPGTPIPASDAYSRAPNPDQFAVLTMTIDEIDLVHLSGDYHRRAVFQRINGWQGAWLAP